VFYCSKKTETSKQKRPTGEVNFDQFFVSFSGMADLAADETRETPRATSARVSGQRPKPTPGERSGHRLYGVGQSASAREAAGTMLRLLADYRNVGNRRVSEGR